MATVWHQPLRPAAPAADSASVADDAALVAAAKVDSAAFAALWDRYYDPVFRYCRLRLPTAEDAEDAANEAFARALAALGRFRDRDGSFRSWLFVIVHNEVAAHHRRAGLRRFLRFLDLLGHAAPGPSPEEWAEVGEEWTRVMRLLDRFPDDQRRVLELRWAGLSGKEIAAVLGKRHDAVRKIESRAEEKLRQLRDEEARDGR
jgi:RNA polymerase sigma-70 factor (ECF subfamily)